MICLATRSSVRLLIIPYTIPSLVTILIWRGIFHGANWCHLPDIGEYFWFFTLLVPGSLLGQGRYPHRQSLAGLSLFYARLQWRLTGYPQDIYSAADVTEQTPGKNSGS